jgi:hypothetical protein
MWRLPRHMNPYPLVGIQVVLIEESYTSKTSFLDLEPVERQREYAGRRLSRGLFRAGDGRRIQADVNASFNIIRKAIPNAFADGIYVVSASGGGRSSASIGLPAHEWLVSCLSMPLVTMKIDHLTSMTSTRWLMPQSAYLWYNGGCGSARLSVCIALMFPHPSEGIPNYAVDWGAKTEACMMHANSPAPVVDEIKLA